MAVREIAQAFLSAERPQEVFQLALDRVSPLVGATLACVYMIEDGSETMPVAAAYNWPERYGRFLDEMRVRVGRGPSGTAVAERRPVEIADVFEDSALADWHPVARELGFRSFVAMPLESRDRVLGASTFYFAGAGELSVETRQLLRVVADQLAATAEKSRLIDDLQQSNIALRSSNEELERQYVALLDARRAKDQFLANISHELRTPLTAVMGYVSLMQEGAAGPINDEQRNTLEEVSASSTRLLTLIGDLIELTSLKRGGMSPRISQFDASAVLRECARPAGEGVTVTVDLPDLSIIMATDRRAVVKILECLVDNAIKFTRAGRITLSARPFGDRIRFFVQDTGIGIAADAHNAVFDEFHQVDASETRQYGGSGVGLALARRLARALGGDVTLASTPGIGSTFTVDLPIVYDATQFAAPRTKP
jgi:signal transduction histidine kinase